MEEFRNARWGMQTRQLNVLTVDQNLSVCGNGFKRHKQHAHDSTSKRVRVLGIGSCSCDVRIKFKSAEEENTIKAKVRVTTDAFIIHNTAPVQ